MYQGVGLNRSDQDFEAFVRASAGALYRLALLLTADHHLAEDLVQATFTKVYIRWARLERKDECLGYARTTLLNTFLSNRRLRSSTEVPTETPSDDVGQTGDDPDTRLMLLGALRTLSFTDRAILVARYWEDRNVTQTAQDLGLSEAVVRTRSSRALKRIRPLFNSLEGCTNE